MYIYTSVEKPGKSLKKPREWNDGTGRVTKESMDRLDRSKVKLVFLVIWAVVQAGSGGVDGDDSAVLAEAKGTYLPGAASPH
jgi:hypothetical protein